MAHRLDRAERGPRERIAAQRRQEQRDRPADQECVTHAAQGLGPVFPGRARDEHSTAERHREHPSRLVEARHGRPVDEQRAVPRACELLPFEQALPPERRGGVEDATVRRDELGERFAALQQPPVRGPQGAAVTDEGGEILGAAAQLLVEVVTEVAPDPRVGEQADAGEHQRHRQREEKRQPDAKRNPHDASR
jgi:hypothetical protein